jgi:DNA-binding transcriptional ArsR family regulator
MNEFSYYRLFFKAVSNSTRLEIIKLLKKGPKSVTELANELNFEQSRVSHNLKCLLDCGFVSAKLENGFRIYSLNKEVKKILDGIEKHLELYKENLVRCKILKNA